jgi:hypothetical protein
VPINLVNCQAKLCAIHLCLAHRRLDHNQSISIRELHNRQYTDYHHLVTACRTFLIHLSWLSDSCPRCASMSNLSAFATDAAPTRRAHVDVGEKNFILAIWCRKMWKCSLPYTMPRDDNKLKSKSTRKQVLPLNREVLAYFLEYSGLVSGGTFSSNISNAFLHKIEPI